MINNPILILLKTVTVTTCSPSIHYSTSYGFGNFALNMIELTSIFF